MLKLLTGIVLLSMANLANADPRPSDLRLVPFPREISLGTVGLKLQPQMVITAPRSELGRQAAEHLRQELLLIAGAQVEVKSQRGLFQQPWLSLAMKRMSPRKLPGIPGKEQEAYALLVTADSAQVAANSDRGLLHGVQTLRQLIRANLRDGAIPAVEIHDWPALKLRGFSDDITRGPSPTPTILQREVDLSGLLRMNFFTYYLEHQFAFSKHPEIGPNDGSLWPEELKTLVEYARLRGVEIVGNQQSFAHFANILRHEQYKDLRETADVLNPTSENTYQLLDDMYSEQIPLLRSKLFNVCCDETDDLGKGPSGPVVKEIGQGGLYVRHIQRIHKLVSGKYGRRMMMWGDIILKHPDHLKDIPKDTVLLTWGYGPAATFEPQILPFAKAGFDFFVCPGVSCWNLILPDFQNAATNIQNFVRDGAAHGAIGMLNTTWDDDGENLDGYNWHGIAWGAECAWTGSRTSMADFNRRLGAVLFGESGDEFGQAIELLGKTHRLPAYSGMGNGIFWKAELPLANEAATRKNARELLDLTRPAVEHLCRAKAGAKVNADIMDYFIFGAERIRLLATRTLDGFDAVAAYREAQKLAPKDAAPQLQRCRELITGIRQRHSNLATEYARLWNAENRPYALDRVMQRYATLLGRYTELLTKLEAIEEEAATGKPLPAIETLGF